MIRVLVIQLRRLGDVLMTTPLLRHLRATLPDARLDYLCEPGSRQVLEHNPLVDGIRLLPARATAVDLLDWVIDCQGLPKTALLARLSGAPVRLGYGGRWWRPLLYTSRYTRMNSDYSALDKLRLLGRLLDESHAVGNATRCGRRSRWRTWAATCARPGSSPSWCTALVKKSPPRNWRDTSEPRPWWTIPCRPSRS